MLVGDFEFFRMDCFYYLYLRFYLVGIAKRNNI